MTRRPGSEGKGAPAIGSVHAFVGWPRAGNYSLRRGSVHRGIPGDSHSLGYPYGDKLYHNNTWVDVAAAASGAVPAGASADETVSVRNTAGARAGDGSFLVALVVMDGEKGGQIPRVEVSGEQGGGCCGGASLVLKGTEGSRTYAMGDADVEVDGASWCDV